MLTYKRYDTSGIDGSKLTAPPALEALPYRMDTLLRTTTVTGNGTVIVKEGIEFQYASPRVPLINTRLTINGAWFHSIYGTASPEYYAGSFRQINGITISNRFIGLYEWSSGYVKDQFSSNIIADTYLDKLGLILSATAECFWLGWMRAPSRLPRPVAYVDVEGNQYAYTDADASDLYKRWLILGNQKNADMIQRERAYMCLNIKASKRFGRYATLAFFADRLLNIAPDYEVDGFIVRRIFTPDMNKVKFFAAGLLLFAATSFLSSCGDSDDTTPQSQVSLTYSVPEGLKTGKVTGTKVTFYNVNTGRLTEYPLDGSTTITVDDGLYNITLVGQLTYEVNGKTITSHLRAVKNAVSVSGGKVGHLARC